MSDSGKELALGRKLAKAKRTDDAWRICDRWLEDDPNDPNALSLAAYILHETKQFGLAYQAAKRATELAPHKSEPITNLGRTSKELGYLDDAEFCFRKSVQLSESPELRGTNLSNLSSVLNDSGKFSAAERVAFEALQLAPHLGEARGNYGIALLAQGKWEGWEYYRATLGLTRLRLPAGSEPDWDGTKNKSVLFYADQGLGDEISFASMLPKAIEDCKKVVIECDPKLGNLFQRSFPSASVYGTRKLARSKWNPDDLNVDYNCSFGDLGAFYCLKNPDGKPYLKSDPQRRLMWRALFDTKKKPVIGIAWTGGVRHTGAKFREVSLEQLLPIFKSVDAHWVCLQYRDSQEEIDEFKKLHGDIDLVQYPFATLTPDYDDTAALVSECDLVVSMQTAVVHLCGALGKECLVLLPKRSQWRYGEEGSKTHWYESVSLYRQKTWGDWKIPIHRIKDELASRELRKAA